MSEDLKDILSNLNPDIDQETLLQYLQGKLSPQQQHEVEKKNISLLVNQLNTDLKKRTEKKKRSRQKLQLNLDSNLIIAIVIILLLIIISYLIIHKQLAH
jgi:hypothetical protein